MDSYPRQFRSLLLVRRLLLRYHQVEGTKDEDHCGERAAPSAVPIESLGRKRDGMNKGVSENHTAISRWEGDGLLLVQSMRNPVLDRVMNFASFVSGSSSWTVICLVAFVVPILQPLSLALAVAVVTGTLLSQGTKRSIQRPRPRLVIPQLSPMGRDPDPFSFPSGHTTATFSGATVLSLLPGMGLFLILFACVVGFSRIYKGVHFPLDVLAGALLGIFSGLAAIFLVGLL